MRKKEMDVFVIEEDARFSAMLEKTIKDQGHNVICFQSVEDWLRNQRKNPDLAFIGQTAHNAAVNMSLIQEVKINSPDTKLVVMSQKESLDLAIRALKNGASDFLVKDGSILARVGTTLKKAEETVAQKKDSITDRLKRFAIPAFGVSAVAMILRAWF